MRMLRAGDPAPALSLLSMDGKPRPLAELWRDGTTVLVLFKVSCPVCQLAFPYLERISGGSLRFVAISQDNAKATAAFEQKFGVTFLTLLDDAASGYPVSNAFGISSVPSIFVVEPDGVISKSIEGFSRPQLEELGSRAGMVTFRAAEHVPAWKPG